MILNHWMENVTYEGLKKILCLAFFLHLSQYISTIKYVIVSALAKKKKKIPPFGAIKYTELKAET